MKQLKLSQIAKAIEGEIKGDATFNNVVIDTRKITPNSLFVCIKGERFDAHNFAREAVEKGASCLVVSRDVDVEVPQIKVEDTSIALLKLGKYYRSLFDIPIVALTGSVGKTTTKEFISLVVGAKYNTTKTQGNLNNEIGLPQTLFQIDETTEAAVIEMGMNHFGEISRLTRATKPSVAVITNIGVSHIENLGSQDGIFHAKLEILEGLKEGAPLILNGDDERLKTVKSDKFKVVFFGLHNGDFIAKNIVEDENETTFEINYFEKSVKAKIPCVGIHNVYNALAAFAVGYYLNVDELDAVEALKKYAPAGMRQKIVKVGEITSIEDCYNASPDSMRASITTLKNIKGNKKIAVLGDMLELGDYAETAHILVGEIVGENKIDYLLAFGNDAKYYVEKAKEFGVNAELFDNKNDLSAKLLATAKSGDAVLFKASRGMKLEDVINTVYEGWGKDE